MKKYLSVFMLCARSTLYKLLFILMAMSAAQIFLFYTNLDKCLSSFPEELYGSSFSDLIYTAKLPLLFLLAFILTTILLMSFGSDWKGKTSYTWRRLGIPEKQAFFVQAIYNSFSFFLLYGAEILTMYFIGQLFLKMAPENITSHQTLFINYYGNEFLHSLVPLEEGTRWLRNLLMITGLGFAAAWQPYLQRRGRKQRISFIYAALVGASFTAHLGAFHNDMMLGITSLIVIIYITYKAVKEEVSYES